MVTSCIGAGRAVVHGLRYDRISVPYFFRRVGSALCGTDLSANLFCWVGICTLITAALSHKDIGTAKERGYVPVHGARSLIDLCTIFLDDRDNIQGL